MNEEDRRFIEWCDRHRNRELDRAARIADRKRDRVKYARIAKERAREEFEYKMRVQDLEAREEEDSRWNVGVDPHYGKDPSGQYYIEIDMNKPPEKRGIVLI